jgi:hypothetical protein
MPPTKPKLIRGILPYLPSDAAVLAFVECPVIPRFVVTSAPAWGGYAVIFKLNRYEGSAK